jgi:hypothetical protein
MKQKTASHKTEIFPAVVKYAYNMILNIICGLVLGCRLAATYRPAVQKQWSTEVVSQQF